LSKVGLVIKKDIKNEYEINIDSAVRNIYDLSMGFDFRKGKGIDNAKSMRVLKYKLMLYDELIYNRLEFWHWNTEKEEQIREYIFKNYKTFGNPILDNFLFMIRYGSEKHSFMKLFDVYIDPYLWSLNIKKKDIRGFDIFFEGVYRQVGIEAEFI